MLKTNSKRNVKTGSSLKAFTQNKSHLKFPSVIFLFWDMKIKCNASNDIASELSNKLAKARLFQEISNYVEPRVRIKVFSGVTNCVILLAPRCSGYHYYTTLLDKAWTQVLRRFKSYSRRVRNSRWWGSLTMVPAGNEVKRLSSVNHATKTILHHHHHHHHHFWTFRLVMKIDLELFSL